MLPVFLTKEGPVFLLEVAEPWAWPLLGTWLGSSLWKYTLRECYLHGDLGGHVDLFLCGGLVPLEV